jgi:hypothetical protein
MAIELGLSETIDRHHVISVPKMKAYMDKSNERMKMFRDYLDEVEKFPVKIGDAVMCPDNKVRLVKLLVREHGAQVSELLATDAVVIDNEHNETKFKVTELRRLAKKQHRGGMPDFIFNKFLKLLYF